MSITGEPELVLSIAGDVKVTSGASSVTIECVDKDGKVLIKGTQPWPFIEEPGYPYPHVHQVDSPEKVEGARRCRVLGTDTRLEASGEIETRAGGRSPPCWRCRSQPRSHTSR